MGFKARGGVHIPAPVVVENLRRVWPQPRGASIIAVNDVSCEVAEGTIFGLLGPNGAGKSTTLRMVATLTRPTAGTATVCGFDVLTSPIEVRQGLGYLSATSELPEKLSCREVVLTVARLHQLASPGAATDLAIERYGIGDYQDRMVDALSTGMRQRVRIACAAVHEPPVLILDEPTAGLDLVATERLLTAIASNRERGVSVIFNTPVLREASQICDRIAIIDEGVLRAVDTPAGLLALTATDSLERAFLSLVAESDAGRGGHAHCGRGCASRRRSGYGPARSTCTC